MVVAKKVQWKPCEVAARLARSADLFWLDSDPSHKDGNYSFLGCEASRAVRVEWGTMHALDRLTFLDEAVGHGDQEEIDGDIWTRIAPRWVGFVAYDAYWSGDASAKHPRTSLPVICFKRYPAVYIFDHRRGEAAIVGDDASAVATLFETIDRSEAVDCLKLEHAGQLEVRNLVSDEQFVHERAVQQALGAIYEGEVYQVNLARRFRAELRESSALELFLRMRLASPVPHGFYFADTDYQIASRSMETYLAVDGVRVESKPIKGTSSDTAVDAVDALRTDPKENAEHTMIIDLIRNDLGRIAQVGSVEVVNPFRIERFRHLLHMVSTVRCRRSDDVPLSRIVALTFPPGSVTGTPKRAAIGFIEKLEQHARGIYCGAVGYVTRTGNAQFAVAIRTAIVHGAAICNAGARQTVDYYAGGGIVADSVPEREVAETELKARAFFDAIARGANSNEEE